MGFEDEVETFVRRLLSGLEAASVLAAQRELTRRAAATSLIAFTEYTFPPDKWVESFCDLLQKWRPTFFSIRWSSVVASTFQRERVGSRI